MQSHMPALALTPSSRAELDRLGDEIALLSAHLEAACARLLDLIDVPPPAAVPPDPVHALRARHEAQGLRLPARTACPGWLGEPLDVGWAIDVLHPLALAARPAVALPGSGPPAGYTGARPRAASGTRMVISGTPMP